MMTLAAAIVLAGSVLLAAPSPQEPAPPTPGAAGLDVLAPDGDLGALTLVRSSAGKAVVRFGPSGSALIALKAGDRIGRTAALVREVTPDRVVIEEVTRGSDGRPLRAQIVFREGQAGGRRYMRDPGLDAPTGVRPGVIGPDGKPVVTRKPGKGL